MSAIHPSCDRAGAAATPGTDAPRPTLILATTILASSLAFVDGSVVNVGLPAIGRGLSAPADLLPWIVNAYLLPLSALLLLGGAAGDRFGRKRMLIAGTALFALASVACALAPDIGSASGFNSAMARTGGLVATALVAGFRWAMVAGAVASVAAAVSAWGLVGRVAEDGKAG